MVELKRINEMTTIDKSSIDQSLPLVVHWLIGRGLSSRRHLSIRRGKNKIITSILFSFERIQSNPKPLKLERDCDTVGRSEERRVGKEC